MQCEVEAALEALLEAGEVPEYESVKARVVPGEALACPEVHVDDARSGRLRRAARG